MSVCLLAVLCRMDNRLANLCVARLPELCAWRTRVEEVRRVDRPAQKESKLQRPCCGLYIQLACFVAGSSNGHSCLCQKTQHSLFPLLSRCMVFLSPTHPSHHHHPPTTLDSLSTLLPQLVAQRISYCFALPVLSVYRESCRRVVLQSVPSTQARDKTSRESHR